MAEHDDDQCLDIRSLAKHLRLSRTTILRLLEEDPHFPRPMKLRSQLRWRMASVRRYEERLELLAELEVEKVEETKRPGSTRKYQERPSGKDDDLPASTRKERK